MLFLNTALLLGALGISIPIIIHLLNRQSNRVVDWGAMNFLLESLAIRNRRIQLEEALLMATRCLLVGLLALALARPFIPPGSTVPWLIVLPLLLLAIVGIGIAVVLHDEPKWRKRIGIVSVALLLLCIALIFFEKYLNFSRFTPGAKQDIALIIDGSTSMGITSTGESNFERAVEEARALVKRAPRGHAFSLILGGPSPTGKVLDPTTDRAELDEALLDLSAIDGEMATYQAFTLASLSLARGDNPAKQIVILTDGQNVGWEIGKNGRWNFLREAFRNLPSEPQIMVRQLPLPEYVRNLAITEVDFSRTIVGVDRPVDIAVTVENTGNEAVTPGGLALTIGDEEIATDRSLGQLQPGERQTVRFTHQFSKSGAQAVSATLEVDDDITNDNRGYYAANIADELKVLIVDGRPSGRALDRASAFAALALAPSSLTLDRSLEANSADASDETSDNFNQSFDPTLELVRFLVDPVVIDAPSVGTITDFSGYDVIMLGDVPRLDGDSATALGDFVKSGGGLLVSVGSKAQADFYNDWTVSGTAPLLPGTIDETPVFGSGDGFSPSLQSLTHPALAKISDPSASDFGSTIISTYRKQEIPEALSASSSVGARLNNGDILLSSAKVGDGQVILTSIPLDLSSGNLVTRQAFLPLIHEVVYHLADPAAYQLNLDPGWEINIGLTGDSGRSVGQGLVAKYFQDHSTKEPTVTRQDPSIEFNWFDSSPAPGVAKDRFRVEWTGSIQVPRNDEYIFSATADDELKVWIGGKGVGTFKYDENKREKRKLKAGEWYTFKATLKENDGISNAILYWESDEISKEPIPSSQFRTFSKGDDLTTSESGRFEFAVEGPGGRPRTALMTSSETGSVLKLQGEISSGLYQLVVPEEQQLLFSSFLSEDSDTIPFTVKRDAAESHLEELTDSDYEFLENFVTLSAPQSLEELIGFLNGNQFGQELWKYLAIGAFFFLLIEIALSRWIARSRRMGEEITVQFESKDAPTSAFRDQLVKMGKLGAS